MDKFAVFLHFYVDEGDLLGGILVVLDRVLLLVAVPEIGLQLRDVELA